MSGCTGRRVSETANRVKERNDHAEDHYGRLSHEAHAQVWPQLEAEFGDYAVRMNTIPKYVASTTLKETTWNTTLIEGDVVQEVARLKEQPGGDILKVGTGGTFSRTLLRHGLVDEYLFWLFPVIAGSGGRLYDGVLGLTYTPKRR
ncbi:dihydrofolate reductase family protein [Nonomuraea longispora]|uniref:dihydrofolate reductase family protein n=1 Tax=Nonomuraea longispora TaxID=1848320 RepID=UPI0024827174|nr:dihydrofolate reductase family protein [Nonomuraea longispora]